MPAPSERDAPAPAAVDVRAAWRIAVGGWLCWSAVTGAPFVQAWLWPPVGRAFSGFLIYPEDFFQYLSFAEQAMRGAFLFQNKFDVRPHGGFLINLEWWAAGALGFVLRSPVAGLHAVAVLSGAVLFSAAARVFWLGGLRGRGFGWALALFATGGGLGWLRLHQGAAQWMVPDVSMAIFPWNQKLMGGPHATLGTGLLLWAVLLLAEWRAGTRSRLPFLLCATALGLTRPFDLGVFVLIAVALAADDLSRRRAGAVAGCLELCWLLPVLFYDALAFRLHPSFALWSGEQNVVLSPPAAEFAWALGPALLLVAVARARGRAVGKRVEIARVLWVVLAVVLALPALLPVGYGMQFLNSLGAPILLLAGLHVAERWAPLAVAALAPTSLVLLSLYLNPTPMLFPPRDYYAATRFLEHACRPGDVALAPVDLGLIVAGTTPCRVVIGHHVLTPDMAARADESARFYSSDTPPAWRLGYLREVGASHVALPAGAAGWLGPDPPYAPAFATPRLEIWEASRPPAAERARR